MKILLSIILLFIVATSCTTRDEHSVQAYLEDGTSIRILSSSVTALPDTTNIKQVVFVGVKVIKNDVLLYAPSNNSPAELTHKSTATEFKKQYAVLSSKELHKAFRWKFDINDRLHPRNRN